MIVDKVEMQKALKLETQGKESLALLLGIQKIIFKLLIIVYFNINK
jgi:hypothetical protein